MNASDVLKKVKRLIIGVIGITILLIGIALIVLPGPAFIVIPFGLWILATEFVWARRLLKRVKDKLQKNGVVASRGSIEKENRIVEE